MKRICLRQVLLAAANHPLVFLEHGELLGLLTTLQESLAAAEDPATRCLYRAHSQLASFMPLDAAASCSNGTTGADWRHQPEMLRARTVASTTQFAAQHPEMRDSEIILRWVAATLVLFQIAWLCMHCLSIAQHRVQAEHTWAP